MKKLNLTVILIIASLLLCGKICLGVSLAEAKTFWRSPDGAIVLLLQENWKRTDPAKAMQYDSNYASQAIPGSFHSLRSGGIIRPRYITFSVYLFSGIEGNRIEDFIYLVGQKLLERNYEIVTVHFDKQAKGYIHYRFIHTGHSVSQVYILVGVSNGIYGIEVTAPRQDEERLKEEAMEIFNNIKIIDPFTK